MANNELRIKMASDSSDVRKDLTTTMKMMEQMSNKYKEVNDKLQSRNAEDFGKVLSKNLEKTNAQLDKAKSKVASLEEALDRQSAKSQQIWHTQGDSDAYQNSLLKQESINNRLEEAKARVNELEQEQASITEKTTTEYNAQTEALKQQAEELQKNFTIAEEIAKQDMEDAGTYSFIDGLKKKISDLGSWIGTKFKSLFSGNKGEDIELVKKSNIQETSNGFKNLTGLASKFGLALFGAQTAFTLIKKAVSEILEDNTQLANTINSVWNGLVSAITPIVNSIVQTLATALNYIIAMINAISGLDVLGLMNKANKKANAKKSGSGSSSKQSQQYSFDTAETLQKNEGSGGTSGTSVEDSYLKNVKLSGDLLRYAEKLKSIWGDIVKINKNLWNGIKEGLQYMDSGQRILQVCKDILDGFLDDIKACTEATVEWSANLDFGPLFDGVASVLEELEPILSSIGDIAVYIYQNAILPIATWAVENGLPEVLNTIASILGVISTVIDQMKEPLKWVFDNIVSPIASTIGDALIEALQTIQDYMDKLGVWLSEHPEFVEFVTLLGSIVGIIAAIAAGFIAAAAAVGIFASILSSPIAIIAAIIAAIGVLLIHMGTMEEFIENLKLILQGVLEFVTGVFTGDWEKAWEGIKDIFKGLWNGIVILLESAINFIVDGINTLEFDVPDWVPLIGGTHFGFNIPRASLPRLAKGAVIPPNKEFLAVLGDQTSGRNIETPEGLLREIVQEESGSQEINIVANGDMAQLINLLKLKLQEEDRRVGSSLVVGG